MSLDIALQALLMNMAMNMNKFPCIHTILNHGNQTLRPWSTSMANGKTSSKRKHQYRLHLQQPTDIMLAFMRALAMPLKASTVQRWIAECAQMKTQNSVLHAKELLPV